MIPLSSSRSILTVGEVEFLKREHAFINLLTLLGVIDLFHPNTSMHKNARFITLNMIHNYVEKHSVYRRL